VAAATSRAALRLLRRTPAAIMARSAWRVVSRSSHRCTGRPVRLSRAWAKTWAAWAAGPRVPSMFLGRPTTISPTSRPRAISAMASTQSAGCRPPGPPRRRRDVRPWAIRAISSLTANPITASP